jgi:2,3-bisphosphoglycerate-dependent phosphoglycerate mutase
MKLFDAPFYFLRHGETEVNRLGLVAGSRDVPLNETGRRQALAAAQHLARRGVGIVYSSPLVRARATAERVAAALEVRLVEIAELAERDWGELEGQPRALRQAEVTPAGGEALEAFVKRTLAGLAKIDGKGAPLIVAHSGTYRVLCRQLGLEAPSDPVVNCQPVRFSPDAGRWRIEPLE